MLWLSGVVSISLVIDWTVISGGVAFLFGISVVSPSIIEQAASTTYHKGDSRFHGYNRNHSCIFCGCVCTLINSEFFSDLKQHIILGSYRIYDLQ